MRVWRQNIGMEKNGLTSRITKKGQIGGVILEGYINYIVTRAGWQGICKER